MSIKRRKSHIPAIFLTILLGAGLIYLILAISPDVKLAIPAFFVLLFLFLFFLAGLFLPRRTSFLISLLSVVILILRFFKMDSYLNLILILALLTTIEIYARIK